MLTKLYHAPDGRPPLLTRNDLFTKLKSMINHVRRRKLEAKVWPHVQTPGQYVGGERNIVVKDHRTVRGKMCIGVPDDYTIGMSHHGLQVPYSLMNRRDDWADRAL